MGRDLIKKKVIFVRPEHGNYISSVVEFPVGAHEAVSLIAIHWSVEFLNLTQGTGFVFCALSENPNHELTPPVGVAEFMREPTLYGFANWMNAYIVNGAAGASSRGMWLAANIPLYGLLRPKRQIAIFANFMGALNGIRGEIYYEEVTPPSKIVDAINRRYGKYRRT